MLRWDMLKEALFDKLPIAGAEIGVQTGKMLAEVLYWLPSIEKYYAIDPYVFYDDFEKACLEIPKEHRTKIGRDQKSMDNTYKAFLQKIKDQGIEDRVRVLKMFSSEAAAFIDDGSLDFCFIDGNHLYEYVLRDIEMYLPKIKKGGLIAGHDYGMEGTGVKRAVNDFFNKGEVVVHQDWTWSVWV